MAERPPHEDPVEIDLTSGTSRLAFFAAMTVGLVLVVLIAILATSDGDAGFARSPLIARPAPLIAGTAVDGSTFDLDDERGRWVVVNFFSTTCVPCIEEHPELVAFDAVHSAAGDASVVSVAFSDSSQNVREFFAKNGGDWAILAEDTGRYAVSYGVAAVPETYLVSPSGIVASKFIGGVTKLDIEAEMSRLSGTVATS